MAATIESEAIWGENDILTDNIRSLSVEELNQRIRLIENEIRVMRQQQARLQHEMATVGEKIKDNTEKIKLNKQLPYLVANVIEVSRLNPLNLRVLNSCFLDDGFFSINLLITLEDLTSTFLLRLPFLLSRFLFCVRFWI